MQTDRTLIVIPARMSSQRLPGKPLAKIMGIPMIVHVWRHACLAGIGSVWVAAADTVIKEVIDAEGGQAILTDSALSSGSDRVAAAVEQLDPDGHYTTILNLQGDLPSIMPSLLHSCLLALNHADIGTVVAPVLSSDQVDRESSVKTAIAFADTTPLLVERIPQIARVLYFSRRSIPWGEGPVYHHIGIYAWRREALRRFTKLNPGRLEIRERLEQLRALEAGMRIDAALVKDIPLAVDTPEDLEQVRTFFKQKHLG